MLPITALCVALGCGADPEPAAQEPVAQAAKPEPADASGENGAPVIDRIRFEPEVPVPGRPLRALVDARDPDGDELFFEYHWRIDGRDAGDLAVGADLDLTGAEKGQSIEVEVVASDGRADSRPYGKRETLENRPPEIAEIDLEPGREVVSGTPVVVYPSGTDPDGDSLTYHYTWIVNGRDLGEAGALLETQRMRRGDEIRVRVVASDGEDDSEAVELPPVVIVNAPPRVVSSPPSDMPGGMFRYEVVAEDPDGDPHLEYRLEGAPSGMQIDPYAGVITWTPTPQQAGVHSVTVLAQDMHEGVGEQVFEVRIRAPETAQPSPGDETDEEADLAGFDADADQTSDLDDFEDDDDETAEVDFFADDDEEEDAPAEVAP